LNMLAFSRERKPEIAPLDLNGLVEEVFSIIRPRADRIGVKLEFDRDRPIMGHADSRGMYRVLLNLVTNALDACEKNGGTVTVRTYSREDGCCIEIRDTGPGIPEDVLPKLSQAFVSTKGSSGTGLGLACSYKIVREHGGEISARNHEDGGAEFTIFIPSRERQGESQPKPPDQTDHPAG